MYQKMKTIICVLMFSCLVGGQLVYAQLTEAQEGLLEAVKAGNVEDVSRLLDDGIDPDFPINEEGESLLFAVLKLQRSYALEPENVLPEALNVFRLLLDAGANPNVLNCYGDFIINQALDYPEYLQVLIEYEANPNVYYSSGLSPLHVAVEHGLVKAVQILLQAPGINVNQQTIASSNFFYGGVAGMTVLHFVAEAIMPNHNEILDMLLNGGANPTLEDENGNTPAMLAQNIEDEHTADLFHRDWFLLQGAYAFN